ncbi:MAG: DNA polymerase domain-containing protein, partial [Candidatus Dormibacteria bacterium]
PNPFQVNVMAFLDEIPNEFNIMKYIDYEMQFEVTFIKPLTIITEAIGWQLEQSDSLDAFFG